MSAVDEHTREFDQFRNLDFRQHAVDDRESVAIETSLPVAARFRFCGHSVGAPMEQNRAKNDKRVVVPGAGIDRVVATAIPAHAIRYHIGGTRQL